MKEVAAVIIVFNRADDLRKTINVLKDTVNEIIVVDNGSNRETYEMLLSLKDEISLIRLEENMGIAYGLNVGIDYGLKKDYKWILTLDHDSIPEKNMISNMLNVYENLSEEKKNEIVMLTPRHIEKGEKNSLVEEEYNYVLTEITSGALTKAEYYMENKYDDKLFIDLVDHDFCLDINKKGKKIITINSAILNHELGNSTKKKFFGITITPTNHSPIRRYYMSRNRRYIWSKYKNDFSKWVIKDKIKNISENIKILLFEDEKIEKMKMIKKGREDFLRGKWGRY